VENLAHLKWPGKAGAQASKKWRIWHILSITEHFLIRIIPYFHEHEGAHAAAGGGAQTRAGDWPLPPTMLCIHSVSFLPHPSTQ